VITRLAAVTATALLVFIACNPFIPKDDTVDLTVGPRLSFSFDVRSLDSIGHDYNVFRYFIYPDTSGSSWIARRAPPKQEILLQSGENFQIALTNCRLGTVWEAAVEDSAIEILSRDSTITLGNGYTTSYIFRATRPCKGCIGFAEFPYHPELEFTPGAGPGLILGYTCDPPDTIDFHLSEITWVNDTTFPSTLWLCLSGRTNACKIKVETYGDGAVGAAAISIDPDGRFHDTVAIAFVPMSGEYLTASTRIALYGTPGFPKIIPLRNPRG
jgi:hypothetical protein